MTPQEKLRQKRLEQEQKIKERRTKLGFFSKRKVKTKEPEEPLLDEEDKSVKEFYDTTTEVDEHSEDDEDVDSGDDEDEDLEDDEDEDSEDDEDESSSSNIVSLKSLVATLFTSGILLFVGTVVFAKVKESLDETGIETVAFDNAMNFATVALIVLVAAVISGIIVRFFSD